MKTLKLKSVSAAFALITGFFLFTVSGILYDAQASPDYLTGKVQYSDDHSPVTEGNVKIMTFDKSTRTYNVLETITIDQQGSFKVNRNLILTTDEIRIMAYPNDVDNNGNPFEPKEINLQNYEYTENKNFEILIEVDRATSTNSEIKMKIVKPEKSSEVRTLTKESVSLDQNYPNPFNPTTVIRFDLPESKNVSLTVYNMKGESVAVLAENELMQKGLNQYEFNAGNLPSGVYVYTLKAGNFTENKKMTLLK
ncbi:MAG TPA: T9SS type A sorting domain-containing protein [Ignavibacteria bacterium]|nr:T9SS type A sorting domain-containing protein [Ignavibacteria bacterium]HRA99870.1 T9SS type A sorting domain-containing protein [Ignavibacteria bacterium]